VEVGSARKKRGSSIYRVAKTAPAVRVHNPTNKTMIIGHRKFLRRCGFSFLWVIRDGVEALGLGLGLA
jgi:hypothetical protein